MSIIHKMQSAWSVLIEDGPRPLLKGAAEKFVQVESYLAYRIDLGRLMLSAPAEISIEIRRATGEDFKRFKSLPHPFPRHAEFREKFGLDQCYLGTIGGEIAHIAWIYYPGQANHHPTRFRCLRSDEVAIANCVTLPCFRGKGVYPAVLRQLLQRLRSEGYRYCYMYIDAGNEASCRGVAKVGFAPVGRSWRIRFCFHHDPAAGIYIRGHCPRSNLNETTEIRS